MSALPNLPITEAEYLAFERESETRHEFINGQIIAMSGASREHNLIAGSTYVALYTRLRNCEIYPSDMKVRTPASESFVYPDISIACEDPVFADDFGDVLLNPTLVIEVLSPSTEEHNRNLKFDLYWSIPSLRSYVLIAQDKPRIERFTRQGENEWLMAVANGLNATIDLPTIGCTLPLAEVYERVSVE